MSARWLFFGPVRYSSTFGAPTSIARAPAARSPMGVCKSAEYCELSSTRTRTPRAVARRSASMSGACGAAKPMHSKNSRSALSARPTTARSTASSPVRSGRDITGWKRTPCACHPSGDIRLTRRKDTALSGTTEATATETSQTSGVAGSGLETLFSSATSTSTCSSLSPVCSSHISLKSASIALAAAPLTAMSQSLFCVSSVGYRLEPPVTAKSPSTANSLTCDFTSYPATGSVAWKKPTRNEPGGHCLITFCSVLS
mmetsp:Transcript_10830/g.45486  ORF Transcript_10830/g.45486 Transcript_10830/m.45486 type:complete len:257 (-) Transcript_10830:1104-1874(-)